MLFWKLITLKKKKLVSLKSDNRLNTVNKLIKQANLHAFLPRPASVYMDFKVSSNFIHYQYTVWQWFWILHYYLNK